MIRTKLMITMTTLLLIMAGCHSSDISSSENSSLDLISYSEQIKDIRYISTATGAQSKSRTDEMTVGGTDLGFPLYNEDNDTMYLGFGDTFTSPLQSGRWRSNTVGISTDDNFADGLDIDGFISSPSGIAKPFIEGQHIDRYEMTKIPTGGIEIDGVMYWFYFSKYTWNNPSPQSMNYGGAVKSIDQGATWERVYSLTWVNHIVDDLSKDQALVADIQRLVNQDVDLMDDGGDVNLAHHEGYDFTQIFPKKGNDGYIYLFGEGGYRSQGLKLARVLEAQFEDFDAIEYLIGYDNEQQPIWVAGRDGLDAIKNNNDSFIIGSAFGEMSVVWNGFLNKWMALTCTNNRARTGAFYFISDNIYGPWSQEGVLLFPPTNLVTPNGAIYAPLTHERWQEDNGRIFYLLISTWMPAYNPSFLRVELW